MNDKEEKEKEEEEVEEEEDREEMVEKEELKEEITSILQYSTCSNAAKLYSCLRQLFLSSEEE